jgi:hypothetical protein
MNIKPIVATAAACIGVGFGVIVAPPPAQALPCDYGPFAPGCVGCMGGLTPEQQVAVNNPCGFAGRVPIPGVGGNHPGYGRDRACAESGICPGAAWVNRNGGVKTAPCVHFPDDPPGMCAPLSPGAAGPPPAPQCAQFYSANTCDAAGYAPSAPPPQGDPSAPQQVAGGNADQFPVVPIIPQLPPQPDNIPYDRPGGSPLNPVGPKKVDPNWLQFPPVG